MMKTECHPELVIRSSDFLRHWCFVIRHFHVASNRKPYHKPAARSRRWRLPFYTAPMRFNEGFAQRQSQTRARDGGIEARAAIELGENPWLVFGQNSNPSILRFPHRLAILLP